MSEPPMKKSKPNQCYLIKLTDDKTKWYKDLSPAGKWRHFTKIKINYTSVTKKWKYDINEISYSEHISYLVTFGIMKSLLELWQSWQCYRSYNILSINIQENLNISANNYQVKKMRLHLSHEGDKGVK